MNFFRLFLICTFLSGSLFARQSDLYFAGYPSLTPDGQTIIFSYENGLWKVPSAGGTAVRITAMEGTETRPVVSPDGQWLAFSSSQYGNMDIYVMPLDGGEIRQLTWHQAADELEGWSWDSESLYFTSNRENRFGSWQVNLNGGTPKRVFSHYHITDHNIAEHPDGRLFFNTSWESKSQEHRKRYKGSFAPQIETWQPQTNVYEKLTDYQGKDMWPAIDSAGNIFFVSDEANGEYNLYTFNGSEKQQLTNFNSSIKHPAVSANGEYVVFIRDYQIWLYHVASGEANPVQISVYGNSTLEKDQNFQVQRNITAFDVSPDKKKLAFVSRGELFISDADGKFVRQLSTSADGRVMEVKWLKDNTTIMFSQTWNGYQNWFTIHAESPETETQITEDLQNNRFLSFDNDQTKGVYLSGKNELRVMDLNSFESETVAEDEIWDFSSSSPSFSPDGRYIVYTAVRNFEENIFIYHLEEEHIISLTDTYVSETGPVWSPDGNYIYFQTNRTRPAYPYGMRDADIYRIALKNIQPDFRSDRVAGLFDADEEEENGEEEKPVVVQIDEEGLRDRWEQVGASFGTQSSPFVYIDGEKTVVLYRSNHDQGQTSWWKTVYEPFESQKTEKIDGTQMGSGQIIESDGSHWVLMNGEIYTLDISGGSVEKVEINHHFRRNLRDEFNQMFDEMWANLEVNFYHSDFHGKDWEEIRDYYRTFLPHVRNRNNLREMMNDMLGELNTSHIGFSSFGGEENTFYGTASMAAGILFEPDSPYTVLRTVRNSPAWTSDTTLQPGDQLVRVNGELVDTQKNREFYFSGPVIDSEISLTFTRNGNEFTLKLQPEFYFSVNNLLYDEWMHQRQQIVDEQSDKRIAYVHMKNMGGGELQHFLQEMVAQGENRDALILDLRYNTGGNVHDEVLRFLSQRAYLNWAYRDGNMGTQSNFTPADKPTVLLINEQSLSDAEMTAAGFKELGLGTVIGMETYRWIIFTSGRGLVDGSFYRLPSWGVYNFAGDNLEQTGVAPDIEIPNTFDDLMNDRDPQLDYAIQYIMERLD